MLKQYYYQLTCIEMLCQSGRALLKNYAEHALHRTTRQQVF